MSKLDKLIARLSDKPKNFTWEEAVTLMKKCGFEIISNSGSRRKFFHREKDIVVCIHRPHPTNELKKYQLKDITNALKTAGFIGKDNKGD